MRDYRDETVLAMGSVSKKLNDETGAGRRTGSADEIGPELWLEIMGNTLRVMEANCEYLNLLDAQIGDGEHGLSMVRGFRAVNERLAAEPRADSSALLRNTGMALMESVGGAAGPLYGSFYLKGAAAVSGKVALDKRDLAALLRAGLEGVQKISRGTKIGDKTMVDTLAPAASVLGASADGKGDLTAALVDVVDAARRGMESTIGLRAKKGRASYQGENSEGHQDPGATSSYLILRTILDTVSGRPCLKVCRYEASGLIVAETALEP
jgi:phosphoenolpyruvate---glycerone phosphotransferase subunit DhaL